MMRNKISAIATGDPKLNQAQTRACGAWGASMSTHCPVPPAPCRQYLPACHGNRGFWCKKKPGANVWFFLHRNEWRLNYWIYEFDPWICTFLPLKLETLNFTNKNEMHTFPKQRNKKWQGYGQESRWFTSWTVQNVPFYRLNSGYLQHKERNWNMNHWAQLQLIGAPHSTTKHRKQDATHEPQCSHVC